MQDYVGSGLWLKTNKSAAEKYYFKYVLVSIMLVQIKLSDENIFHFVEYQNQKLDPNLNYTCMESPLLSLSMEYRPEHSCYHMILHICDKLF